MRKYAKENLKRIPLDVQKAEYDKIKAAADNAGEKVNAYIKGAIKQRMDRESANAETLEAIEELSDGGGHKFSGTTDALFAELTSD